jgi:hypothetical protein
MRTHILAAAFLCTGALSAIAAEKDPFADKDKDAATSNLIRAQVEYVEMSHEALTGLLRERDSKPADDAALYARVMEMCGKKEAKIFETTIVTSRDSGNGRTKSNSELIYPTEAEPPEFASKPDKNGKEVPDVGFTPTACATRELGSSLFILPPLAPDGRTIDLEFACEMVWHTGQKVWSEIKDKLGNVTKVEMPLIYSMMIKGKTLCMNGNRFLAGTVSPKDDAGNIDTTRKILVFVKCDVVPVE